MQLKDLAESQNAASSVGDILVEVAENGSDNSNSDYNEEEAPTFTKAPPLLETTPASQEPRTWHEQQLTRTK